MNTQHKFKSLVHYVCSRRAGNPSSLGAVKLNKILWMADISAYYSTGSPITNSRYIKQRFGPVPARIVPVIRELEVEGYLTAIDVNHFGNQKREYRVHVKASGSFLSASEKQLVDEIIDVVCDHYTAQSVSEASHDHIWMAAEEGEELPLYTVFAKQGKITDSERNWANMMLESTTE